jgi:hypothetical protein
VRTAGARGGRFAAAPVVIALALAACGSNKPALKPPCQTNARAAAAAALGVPSVSANASTGSNGSPQCTYAAGRRSVVANINVTPQAYFIVERTAVEASQQFAPIPASKLPVQVPHIGLDAYWYPAFSQFETTDGVPGATRARLIAIGKAAARPYLGKLHPPP